MSNRSNPSHPEHAVFIDELPPEARLLHNIFCACMEDPEDSSLLVHEAPHGPSSLRHPYTADEIAAMGY
jgi:hypothetical protein